MNRQTKRMMEKQGADQRPRAPDRRPGPTPASDRVGPRQFATEVRGELRKVAWPSKREVVNSTIVVLIAVVVLGALIFGLDYLSSELVLFLYD